MTLNVERRRIDSQPIEVRSEGNDHVAYGYAYRFGTLSQNLGGFVETIERSAGAKSIGEHDIRALYNHDPNKVLGRNRSGTLRLEEDRDGCLYEIRLPDTQTGREVRELLERGDVSGSSFGFSTILDEWSETEEGFPLRTLKAFRLYDVGPVTFPAYLDADSAMRTDNALRSLAESRNLDPAAVLKAAADNDLAAVLRGDNATTERDEDRSQTIHRPKARQFALPRQGANPSN